jgi:hypothetical protein
MLPLLDYTVVAAACCSSNASVVTVGAYTTTVVTCSLSGLRMLRHGSTTIGMP